MHSYEDVESGQGFGAVANHPIAGCGGGAASWVVSARWKLNCRGWLLSAYTMLRLHWVGALARLGFLGI
ncbi:hypothetical protein F5Y08DRAFT_320290 [Xylaria arbuscula]|nr:hypothetical protein F5Y08DRAFT_320290 [Xylaria arbuscula]